MESALGWIGAIVEWLGKFIPRWILLDTTEEAVKFTHHWKRIKWNRWDSYYTVDVLSHGGHWYWPWTSKVKTTITARDTMDLEGQVVTLKDRKQVMVSGMVRSSIFDTKRALAETSDISNCIRDEAMTAIHEVLTEYTWDDLCNAVGSKELLKELKSRAQRALTPYGVKVLRIGLKDNAIVRVYKLVQEQS